jgi:hypothetical protein
MIFLSRNKRLLLRFALGRMVSSLFRGMRESKPQAVDQWQAQACRESKLDLRLFT